MKRIFIYLSLFLFISCSEEEAVEQTFSITIEQQCGGSQTEYCVTESTKTRVTESIIVGNPCVWVSFKDINGNNQSGYFRSGGTDSGICD